ncbi:MAG: ribosome small subunit-dependent GTPase A [Burkholderiales bacterium]|nr:ribosome small subunit-dependent GTPase A [Burkholderiales bacterium]
MLGPDDDGVIIAAHGRHYVVETERGALVRCMPRGKRSVFACGDRVSFAPAGREAGVIEAPGPRTSLLLRAAPHRHKLIAANATQVAIIVAGEPSFSDELVSRILVAAESQGIPSLIVLNKTDLTSSAQAALERLRPFEHAGYCVLAMSAKCDIAPLRARLAGESTVLLGQSGMGKSTIVNALVPAVDARTQEVSTFLDSGRHTTTSTRLYRLPGGGTIIDSPGLQGFGLAHLTPAQIEHACPELRPMAGRCRFSDCRHRSEPGCAVHAAVAEGRVHPRRLELLHRILAAEESS